MKKGRAFIFSAPSGCGKTTILRKVQEIVPNIKFSVSSTTRNPRPGEKHGIDYFFMTKEIFIEKIKRGEFLEWACVHSHYYGTERKNVESWLEKGIDVILDIDVQGARQVKCLMPESISIFILPPSFEELERRLKGRGTESVEDIERRLSNARYEISQAYWYDFSVVNDNLDTAVNNVVSIINAYRCKTARYFSLIQNLILTVVDDDSAAKLKELV